MFSITWKRYSRQSRKHEKHIDYKKHCVNCDYIILIKQAFLKIFTWNAWKIVSNSSIDIADFNTSFRRKTTMETLSWGPATIQRKWLRKMFDNVYRYKFKRLCAVRREWFVFLVKFKHSKVSPVFNRERLNYFLSKLYMHCKNKALQTVHKIWDIKVLLLFSSIALHNTKKAWEPFCLCF